MGDFLMSIPLFALVLTMGAFRIGLWCQKKTGSALCNPILIAALLVIGVMLIAHIPAERYVASTAGLQWLLTPATVCLALPLYEQLKVLGKNLPAILWGIAAGTVTSLLGIFGLCHLFGLDQTLTISLLPKSVTTAMGIVLSGQNGGIEGLTSICIIITGILGSLSGTLLCRLLKLTDPICQGVAFGTASHVIGTSRATQIDPLAGAVSSLSLAISGILTAVLFPLFVKIL
ncbi:MAG: LrgB family protein [Oscillospiraceae bacterium]|nr:LrgB family protein [Oscillospiraceae bacterium]